jgi:hypothetical protein
VQRRAEGRRRLADAVAQRIPEQRDPPRQVDGDAQLLARLQESGGEIRLIAELLRQVEDAGPLLSARSTVPVETPSCRAMSLIPTGAEDARDFSRGICGLILVRRVCLDRRR